MRALLLIVILSMLASCASKPIEASTESDFYIGCIGGMITRDKLSNDEMDEEKLDVFMNICHKLDRHYQTKTKKTGVKFPNLKDIKFTKKNKNLI